jgi:hypothetical protein|tara:strand:- start:286 stop:519 length:234 start_codon:yes stop_codon:yes gene_type:complete
MKINTKTLFEYTLATGFAFFVGMFVTMYKIDDRLWNETVNKAWDIENRFYNYPGGEDDCYTLTDLEMIIFGEIQQGY